MLWFLAATANFFKQTAHARCSIYKLFSCFRLPKVNQEFIRQSFGLTHQKFARRSKLFRRVLLFFFGPSWNRGDWYWDKNYPTQLPSSQFFPSHWVFERSKNERTCSRVFKTVRWPIKIETYTSRGHYSTFSIHTDNNKFICTQRIRIQESRCIFNNRASVL